MDKDFISSLYISQYKNIVLYLTKMGATLEEAEDITQDSFIKIYEYVTEIEIKSFNAYLFKIAINKFNNKKNRDRKLSYNLDDNFFDRIEEKEKTEEGVIKEELKNEINEVLNSLKEIYKNLLLIKYDLQLSNEEIANLLNLDKNTVKVYLYRGRKLFVKEYEKRYGKYK